MLLFVKAEKKKKGKASLLKLDPLVPVAEWQRTISICEMCRLFSLIFSNNFQTVLA